MQQRAPEVLLIDADRKRGITLRAWLKQWGYRCETVTNAGMACEALKREEGAAIVLAILQSFRSGAAQVAQQFGQTRQERPLHVIAALPLQPPEKDRRQLPELGPGVHPDDVIVLPLEPRLLRGKLRSAERVVQVQEELAQASKALRFFSTHDALTALPHRSTAMEMLRAEAERSLRTGSPLSVVLFDLDMFQRLNARAGYDAGSTVLREVGVRMRRTMRGYDACSRFGSDEFLLMLPECGLADAMRRTERLRREVFDPPFLLDHTPDLRLGTAEGSVPKQVRLTGCFGVAECSGRHPRYALQEAEQALRTARQQGPGSVACAGMAAPALPPTALARTAPARAAARLQ